MTASVRHSFVAALGALLAFSSPIDAGEPRRLPNMLPMPNETGLAATYSTRGAIDLTGPFFQSLGTNGRSCGTCHQPGDGWTVTPPHLRARFDATAGTDPIFRTNDGAVSPDARGVHAGRAEKRVHHASRQGVDPRRDRPFTAQRQFELVGVDDPYGYASASELSLFRRVLPATNLKFLSTVMWDGRETFKDPASPNCVLGTTNCFASIPFDLADQANGATTSVMRRATQPLIDRAAGGDRRVRNHRFTPRRLPTTTQAT